MLFSIIIPVYKRVDSLRDTLLSIKAQTYGQWEVIVVDQSPPPLDEKVRSVLRETLGESARVRYRHRTEPSLTAARNEGLRESSGEWVIFCDDDVLWPVDLLDKTLRRIGEDSLLRLIGGLDYNLTGRVRPKAIRLFRYLCCSGLYNEKRGRVLPSLMGFYPDTVSFPVDTQWAMGYWFACHSSTVKKNGILFDENLAGYAYGEDMDFSYRIYRMVKNDRGSCRLFPEIGVHHMVSQEWRMPSPVGIRMGVVNRIYFAQKYYGTIGFMIRVPLMILSSVPFAIRLLKRDRTSVRHLLRAWGEGLINFKKIKTGCLGQ